MSNYSKEQVVIDKGRFRFPGPGGRKQRAVARDPAACKVFTTGLLRTNVSCAEFFYQQARAQGLDAETLAVMVGGDEENNCLAVWLVKPGTRGASPVRHNRRKKTLTLYLHDLFEAYPRLRPDAARWCLASPQTDTDGDPCILICLSVPVLQHSSHRPRGPRRKRRQPAPAPAGDAGADGPGSPSRTTDSTGTDMDARKTRTLAQRAIPRLANDWHPVPGEGQPGVGQGQHGRNHKQRQEAEGPAAPSGAAGPRPVRPATTSRGRPGRRRR